MINYILQIILFQVLFLAVYDLFLSKETFFTKNRGYLLSTSVLSFLLPLIKLPTFQKAISQEYIVYLPEIFLSPEKVIQKAIETSAFYQSINYISVLFWVGVFIFLVIFIIKLIKVINLIRKNNILKKESYQLVLLPKETKAFSFFNYIFLGEEIPESQLEKIIQHELVHSKQKHSLDLLFFEFLKIVMWFNPMIYLYQKRITLLHEYISDEVVAKSETKETYINNLLSKLFQVENISFINQFYKQTFIKKRIMMMTKNKSQKMNQLKYLVLIPVLTSMLFYVACTNQETVIEELPTAEYQSKIKINNEFYFLKQNDLGETIGYNNKGEKVDVMSLLREDVKAMYFEDGYLVTEFNYPDKEITTDEITTSKDLEEISEKEEISFMKISKAPTFPGCETGDKKCFSKMIQKHFVKNFDANLPKKLNLSSGRKRIFINFKIDKEGAIEALKVKAPHKKIQEEVIRVLTSLPNMQPGEHKGQKIAVNYSIPFTIVVE